MLFRSSLQHPLFILPLVGIGYAAASVFSHAYELPDARMVVVWLSAGVLFSAMVLLAATANNLDPVIAAVLFRWMVGARIDLRRLRDAFWLVAACCAGPRSAGR